ncbi:MULTISPECIES: PAS domain S-box protein [Natrialbaceae]|uniref:PAS domain S-box protein n=1 Tax=Natrialbaceae TaxID=1644061 RepID=UPI00207D1A12|nr:PAS domain S-box protein [Natronococcus sp. CG52]
MSSSRVEAELRKRVSQQEVVADLSQRVLDTDDPDELLADVSDAVRTAVDADACRFFERLPHGDRAVCREADGWTDEQTPTTITTDPDGSLLGYALQHEEPVVVDDLQADDRFDPPDRLLEHDASSSLCVPIGPDGEPWGVLEAHGVRPQAFDEADTAVLRTIANVLTTAFETNGSDRRLDGEWSLKEQFLERSPVGITVVDTDGKMQFANERAAEILGRSREEIADFTHDDPRWGLIDTDGTSLPAGDHPFDRVFEAGESTTNMEVGAHRPDGTRIWLSIDGAPLRSDGSLIGGVFAITDVTEQKRLENEFEEMIDRVTDAFYALDDEFRFTHVNERAEELLQHSEAELLGERLWNVFPEAATEEEVWDSFNAAMETQEPTSYELYFEPLDFWVEANLYPSESGISVYFRDITARKEREQKLEQYRSLTEAAQDVVLTIDEESTIQSVNPAVEDVFGYDRNELVGESLTTLMPERLVNGHRRGLGQYLETGARTLEWEYVELPGRHADGSEIPLAISFSEVEYEGGRFFTGILRDITDRKAHERRLREERDLTNRIVETSPTGIITVGPDGSFERVNERTEEITGYSGKDLEKLIGGTAGFDPVKPGGESFSADEIPTQRVLADGETIHDLEIGLLRADGERVWLSLSGTPLWDDGGSSGAVFTFADITERREYHQKLEETNDRLERANERLERSNERLESSNERLEHFAYATSHDLQEPLRMVSSYLRLIEDRYGDALDEDGEEFLAFAVDGADRMREMIDGLLTYSRIETRGQPLEPVALNDVVDAVRTDLQLQFDESDATLTAADLPRVEGDPSQLRQLFQNLFDNAIEYSGDEPPTIEVSAERAGEMWVVSVSDRGIGIPEDETAVIFEVFERLHTIDEHEGTGIGLALCQRIVERHGGEIWVDSEPGEGSTFSLTLPAVMDDQP